MSDHSVLFLQAVREAIAQLEPTCLDQMAEMLAEVRDNGGRIFFLGVGGSAANASHAVNDFRKIAGIECYAPSDNVSELTARTNDNGWDSCYVDWLRVSRLNAQDAVFVFSVGGGDLARGISGNIVRSLELARCVGARILGVVGRDGGHTAQVADACVIIPSILEDMITPLTEALQAVIWHLIVSHPRLKLNKMKWESTAVSV
jgi:D-sedoheptulose 7-phosphate isomerase